MPHIVLVSGSLRVGSTSDRIATWCAEQCSAHGATTRVFTGAELDFPFYRPGLSEGHPGIREFLRELRRSDGVVLISPTYHGSVSGLLKNALDYVNDLAGPRIFLDGRTIGCVAIGTGTQGTVSTLGTLRTISHALRGWPTPLGVVVTQASPFDATGTAGDAHCRGQLLEMIAQVLSMSERQTVPVPASVGAP
ncbi:NADPH-dependent FMN reductase [Streptomyces litchfieldiae]|uniref:NAD(P)H-dependent oxidoreductase n=1 Tax=Streptomyces litchfieldiae TaxID=3075543 RepID=A0ABU2MZ03_9ACTN|nr:NAD(P)H-dependent oxidoreductase [Streptomyces sp. DSM 44938]MDT0346877.1 NAD(P)H-dependent oxidoreductase [Streptomyces sp. DSM 44938]